MKKYYTPRCETIAMKSADVITLSVSEAAFNGFSATDLKNAWDWDE